MLGAEWKTTGTNYITGDTVELIVPYGTILAICNLARASCAIFICNGKKDAIKEQENFFWSFTSWNNNTGKAVFTCCDTNTSRNNHFVYRIL